MSASQVIPIHLPGRNMPSKLHIYAIYLMAIYSSYMCIYLPHDTIGMTHVTGNDVHRHQWWQCQQSHQMTVGMAELAYVPNQPKMSPLCSSLTVQYISKFYMKG